jgi:trigger factor
VSHELSDLVKRLEESKLTLEDYLKHENKDMDQLRSEMETTVNERIKGGLVLGQIADVEKITVTKEDLDAELDKMAETYKVPVASIRARFEGEGMRNLANSILQRKIVDFLVNAAQVTEVSEKSA